MSDNERHKLLNSQYEPPEGIDPTSLRWAADYAWAMAQEVEEHGNGGNATELRALTHAMRGLARIREMADTCCAWCRKLPPLLNKCPNRPKRKARRCASAKHVRDYPGCYSRTEVEASVEYRRMNNRQREDQ